jgi:hypothetical protein
VKGCCSGAISKSFGAVHRVQCDEMYAVLDQNVPAPFACAGALSATAAFSASRPRASPGACAASLLMAERCVGQRALRLQMPRFECS